MAKRNKKEKNQEKKTYHTSQAATHKKGIRKLHLPDGIYEYKHHRHNIEIWTPEGNKEVVSHEEITGYDCDYLERAHHKGYYPPITPSLIRQFIENDFSFPGR